MNQNYIFTSESVTEGHPDKICDAVSDAILDEYIKHDKNSRVACEVMFADRTMVIGGEINSKYDIQEQEYIKIAKQVLRNIGYEENQIADIRFIILVNGQSPEIHNGVDSENGLGAGDQGIMFGYATNETPNYMPAPLYYSHLISKGITDYRKENPTAGLLPDGKVQVSMKYKNDIPVEITDVIISSQHNNQLTLGNLRQFLKMKVKDIFKITGNDYTLLENTKYHINPAGEFHIGGAEGDCGLTGRKIVVDTYGGACPHGGGAFSGKDASKVDRSAAYMARYIAKNLCAAGVDDKITVQLSYAIGEKEPVSIYVKTKNYSSDKIEKIVLEIFDLTPQGIIDCLKLDKPIFSKTTNYGHFGKEDLPWEKLDKVKEIKGLL